MRTSIWYKTILFYPWVSRVLSGVVQNYTPGITITSGGQEDFVAGKVKEKRVTPDSSVLICLHSTYSYKRCNQLITDGKVAEKLW